MWHGVGMDLLHRAAYKPPYDWAAMLAYLERAPSTASRRLKAASIGAPSRTTAARHGRGPPRAGARQPGRHGALPVRAGPARDPGPRPAGVRRGRRHRDDRRAPVARPVPGAALVRSGRACARRAGGTASSSRCARSSASRSRWPRRASSPAGWWRSAARRLETAAASHARCRARFPSPARRSPRRPRALGMPAARRAALKALAEAALADPHLFRPFGTVEEAIARLRSIRGVGEWTAQYIALRALRETDAFPGERLGLLRGAAPRAGARPTPADLLQRASPGGPGGPTPPSTSGPRMRDEQAAREVVMAEMLRLLVDRTETPIGELMVIRGHRGTAARPRLDDYEDRLLQLCAALRGRLRARAGAESWWAHGGDGRLLRGRPRRHRPPARGDRRHALPADGLEGALAIPLRTQGPYSELARRIGRPAAVRAVGLANGANPVGIVVPCHRVVGSNGSLTGYGGGLERKRWLLAHEGYGSKALGF